MVNNTPTCSYTSQNVVNNREWSFGLVYPPPANQEVLLWLKKLQQEVGSEVTDEKLKDFIWKTLNSGQVGVAL